MSNYSKCKYFPEFKDFQSGCSTCDWINPAKYYNTQGWSVQNYNVGGSKKGGAKRGVCAVADIGSSKPSDLQYNGSFSMTQPNWMKMLTGSGVQQAAQNNQAVQSENRGVGYNTQGGMKKKSTRKPKSGKKSPAKKSPAKKVSRKTKSTKSKRTVRKQRGGNVGATYLPPQFFNPNLPLTNSHPANGSSFPCNNLTPTDPLFQQKGGQCPVNLSTSKCQNTQEQKAQAMNCNLNEATQKNNKLESTVIGSQTGGTGYRNPGNNTLTNEIYGNYMNQAFELNDWQNQHYYRDAKADYSSITGGKKLSRRNQKAGGSDFVTTWRSRGPVNYPNQDPKQFRAFTKTGEYIPNNELAFAAAPVLTGCMPDNSPVQGYNVGDYVTGGAKKRTTKKTTTKKSKSPKAKKVVKRTKSATKKTTTKKSKSPKAKKVVKRSKSTTKKSTKKSSK